MKSLKAAVGGLAMLAAVGCNGVNGPPRSSGSLGVSNDSKYLYAADTDNGTLTVLDSKSLEKVAVVKVGDSPFRVSVGKDDTVFVANRGSRSVSVIAAGVWAVRAEIATGVDPVGMQVSGDGKTLYVVSATANDSAEYGILQAVDTATLSTTWQLAVGEEPRGLALVSGDRALISLFRQGGYAQVDLNKHELIGEAKDLKNDVYRGVNQAALATTTQYGGGYSGVATFTPRASTDLAVTPDGNRVFNTTLLSREAPILTQPTPDTPYYKGQGPRLAGSVTTPAVITLDTSNGKVVPKVEDVGGYSYGYYDYNGKTAADPDFPQTSYAVSGFGTSSVLQGPAVAVTDATGDWLFVVNKESSNVAVISANRRSAVPGGEASNSYGYGYNPYGNELPSVHSTAAVGAGADGVAILGDNATAYVYSQYDHRVQRLGLKGSTVTTQATATIADDVLTPAEVEGRKMFHDANDRSISAVEASVACSSCHLEGRDDGHTWMFPDGPRQTPTLAGRGMLNTQPYHWSGEFPTLQDFLKHTITARMGGTGIEGTRTERLNQFVGAMKAPENPNKHEELTDAQKHGAQVFQAAQCGTCHAGEWLTNGKNSDVGTLVLTGVNPDNGLVMNGLNVPSLRGLSRSAPYLHDGSAQTIRARFDSRVNSDDKHGSTSKLSTADIDDLVSYLKTL